MSATIAPVTLSVSLADTQLDALASERGTPLYVYDLRRLRFRVGELREALGPAKAKLFFATMANDRLQVLELLASLGLGACVNSIPHLELAIKAGFQSGSIQFTSTGTSRNDMRELRRSAIRINLDSLSQLKAWFELGGAEAGIRINAGSLARGIASDRIGIDGAQLGEAMNTAARLNGRIAGLHVYVGTNFQQPEAMLPTLEAFFELAATVSSLTYINIGGGIGVDYQHAGPGFDLFSFGDAIAGYGRQLREALQRDVDVIVEPGRGLTAECGTFVTSVTDVKVLGGRRFVAVDGSIAVFPRPLHHPETPHRIRRISLIDSCVQGQNEWTNAYIVGRTTFSRDILGCTLLPDSLRMGDLLALDDAGAYSQSMASRFLGQPEPHEAFIDD